MAAISDEKDSGLTMCIAEGVWPLGPALTVMERRETEEMKGTEPDLQLDRGVRRD